MSYTGVAMPTICLQYSGATYGKWRTSNEYKLCPIIMVHTVVGIAHHMPVVLETYLWVGKKLRFPFLPHKLRTRAAGI